MTTVTTIEQPIEHKTVALAPFMYTSVTIASTVESFYRSALNNLINQKLTGRTGKYFPDMHIQIPTRIIYMAGLKRIRSFLDDCDFGVGTTGDLLRVGCWFVPGFIMSPMSSILEASNAGHSNPEIIWRRWMRGYNFRLVREVIFAIGLNQAADIITESAGPLVSDSKTIQSAVGSLFAGIVAGYFSHVPHVLSTVKLLNPQKSYMAHWHDLWMKSYIKMYGAPLADTAAGAAKGAVILDPSRARSAKLAAVLFPLGVVRRSIQIAGTFVIINGVMYACRNQNWY